MTWTERMRDAAEAKNIPPDWQGVWAGYLTPGNPYHPWTKADWSLAGSRRKLPIMVRSNAPTDPAKARAMAEDDAFTALRELFDLGARGKFFVCLDRETMDNKPYCLRWAEVMRDEGKVPLEYASLSAGVVGKPFAWPWGADYAGKGPFMLPKPYRATQYASGQKFDSSTVRWWTYTFGPWWK